MRAAPLLPASSACHAVSTSLPTGMVNPTPVITTRLSCAKLLDALFFQVLDGITDRLQAFCILVRDFDAELFFERHYEFDCVERVGAEIFYERSFGRDLVGLDTQLVDNDLFDFAIDVRHGKSPLSVR